ncbi:acyl-CoA thioesterase [Rhizobiaceae bacterium n13]|uniref:Acyl-CoA thioesterase n=1 Tax=Ferirhizobium litorale TaxID=2927786 RepID=A0AAE3QJL8_9HYPH|nr:acyl-CoA thioesterase [Fererhizobium litorale]MDI7862727.1 acyl-CoA thioesterase [Fererhizobium litorale]MDI7924409.1 acyl-CoA thioesterase [Fererhizobium litorale]
MSQQFLSEREPAAGPVPITLIDIVFPGATNHHGTLFGGAGLALMDRAAFIAATRHARVPFVTASCERVDFKKPAHVGEIVQFAATALQAGRRSLTIEVEMTAETVDGTQRHLCTRGVFRMVAAVGDDCPAGWSLPPLAAFHEPILPGEVRMVDIVFADQANSSGRMFGGDALSFMTKGAFVAASRYSRCLTVLASSERIDFRHPIALGSIVEVVARVIGSGRTSMRVRVELWSEELLSGARQLTASGEFAMVAVDAEHRPVNFIPSHLGTRPS